MPTTQFDRLPNIEANKHFDSKILAPSFHYQDIASYEHAVAFTVAKMLDEDLLTETKQALSEALNNGTSFDDFKKRLKPYLMAKGWWGEQIMIDPKTGNEQLVQLGSIRRLRTIYHTNKQTAYAAGTWQRIQESKSLLPYLQYMPSASENKRFAHQRYYNLVRPVDDPIWQSIFPPNGYGCKCRVQRLTKSEAEKIGITPDSAIETEIIVNKRTGAEIEIPKGIDLNFAHNHGDRIGALLKIAEDKHGTGFVKRLENQLNDYMLNMAMNYSSVQLANFKGITVRQSEVNRLKMELDGKKVSLSEGVTAEEWQQYYNVNLERYNPEIHKILVDGNPADFAIIDSNKRPDEWTIIDFMFTMESSNEKGIKAMNYSLDGHKRHKRNWYDLEQQMLDHLEKSDIVPMDLRHWNIKNRIKILNFVLSLNKELQEKIVFIGG